MVSLITVDPILTHILILSRALAGNAKQSIGLFLLGVFSLYGAECHLALLLLIS